MECSGQATRIGNVLTEGQASIYMKDLVSRTLDGIIGILVNEALSSLLKGLNCLVVPPIRVVSGFIIVATGRVKSCSLSVYQIGCYGG